MVPKAKETQVSKELEEPKKSQLQTVKKKRKSRKDYIKDTIKFCIFSALCTIIVMTLYPYVSKLFFGRGGVVTDRSKIF